jgi:hypothetical protein
MLMAPTRPICIVSSCASCAARAAGAVMSADATTAAEAAYAKRFILSSLNIPRICY